jgi:hypothetical protein
MNKKCVSAPRMALVAMATLLAPLGVQAAVPPMCFSDITIRPGTSQDIAPTIDGTVNGDRGWLNSWRYVFHNGTYVHDAIVQGIKDSTNVYLSFEVNHDFGLNEDDAIVLTIDPAPGGPATRRYIRIFPVVPGAAASPIKFEGTTSMTGTGWSGIAHLPVNGEAGANGTEAKASVSGSGTNWSWTVEVKLPMAQFDIPTAGNFGLYVNVMPNIENLVYQYTWPSGLPALAGDTVATPPLASWGTARTNATSCNGVYITTPDIYTDNNPSSAINTTVGALNRFHAIVHNTTLDASGNAVAANNVRAKYSVAYFGIAPNVWETIPTSGGTAPNNPTLEQTIPGNATRDFQLGWTLSAAERAKYVAPNHHQCVLVELDSSMGACVGGTNANAACTGNATCTGGGTCEPTLFSVKSMYRNMDFGALSKFQSRPRIQTKGMAPPPAGQTNQVIDLLISKRIENLDRERVRQWLTAKSHGGADTANPSDTANPPSDNPPDDPNSNPNNPDPNGSNGEPPRGEPEPADGSWDVVSNLANWPAEQDDNYKNFVSQLDDPKVEVSQLTYIARGCRHSGVFIDINGHKYEVCDAVGSFGYVLRHAGLGDPKWSMKLDGPGLTLVKGEAEQYQLKLPEGEESILTASFSAGDNRGGSEGFRKWWWIVLIIVLILMLIGWLRKKGSAP